MKYKIKKISGDASFREFYRLKKGKSSSILVRSRKENYINLILYSAINEILIKNKIAAPKLLKEYFKDNMMEITDLGDKSFTEIVNNSKNKIYPLKKLIDVLINFQKIKPKPKFRFKGRIIKIKKYSISKMTQESDLFFDWYLLHSKNIKNFTKAKKLIRNTLMKVYRKLHYENNTLTHKDFHAANIMLYKKKPYLIDSQDAVLGNPLYDVVSLIDDVRLKIPINVQQELFNYYFKNSNVRNKNLDYFISDFHILSVQRSLKILGIFVRLYKRDNKIKYLKYLPNTWKLLNLRLRHPIFKELNNIMNSLLPMKKLKKFKFNENN